jgi:hypothetical protein
MLKPAAELLIPTHRGVKQLEGVPARQARVLHQKHLTHPARAEPLQHPITSDLLFVRTCHKQRV